MKTLAMMVVVSLSMVLASGALAQEPIPIGYVGPLTGSVALLGNEALKGATLAMEQINAAGGVLGRPLKIFAADNKCNPAEAVAATRKVITRDRVVASIGQLCSSATLAAMPIYESEKIPVATLAERVRHVVQSSFGGRRIVIFSGGEAKGTDEVLKEIQGIADGGAFGSIMGRNAFQRPKADAVKLLATIQEIYRKAR